MPRIPMTIRHFAGALRLVAAAYTTTNGSRKRAWLRIVIDTGSPDSMIGYLDALALQTRFGKPKPEKVNIGAGKTKSFEDNAVYVFKTEDGGHAELKLPVKVVIPLSQSDKHKGYAQSVPSLLGLDFITQPKVRAITRGSANEFFLELDD